MGTFTRRKHTKSGVNAMILTKDQKSGEQKAQSPWEVLKESLEAELEHKQQEIQEIDLMIDQSQVEVSKLTQRNTAITARLKQAQAQFDSIPRSDIRDAYDAALDAQQRLFVMRGQLDKLQSDRIQYENYRALLERVLALESGGIGESRAKGPSSTGQTAEMLIRAQEAERQRLARQMHDGPAQALSNFILQTEIAMRLFDVDQAKAKEELATMKSAATTTFQKVRDFIFELRPMMLDDLGLTPTLTRYVEAYKEQVGMDIRLTVSGLEQRLEPYLEVMIFRAVQELLLNAQRHSQAVQVWVQIDASEADVKVSVDDNGKGFDSGMADDKGGMGLKVIRDRVEMLGGQMEIDSTSGKGTRVSFEIPATKTKVFA
jgi:two-component system sensor histidine kinase DegS